IGGDGPYYVFSKDLKNNFLQVSNDKSKRFLEGKILRITRANWISNEPVFPLRALVKIRYQEELTSAIIEKEKVGLRVVFEKPKKAITAGQSAVFYDSRGMVLGGGIIK
ncbi:MAG: aminomethyltransferase beta-barrel domain-containing protein, partial [Patescibacteria group bacterium]